MPISNCLQQALVELVGNPSLKQRLIAAYSKHLKHVDGEDLPDAWREEFAAICAELEMVRPLPGESAVQATVRKMSAEQADRCAARIVALVTGYARDAADMVPRPAREPRERGDTVIPLFAAEA